LKGITCNGQKKKKQQPEKKVEENSAVRVLLEEQGKQLYVAPGAWLFCLTSH